MTTPPSTPEPEALPLAEFEPVLRKVFAQPKQSLYKSALAENKATETSA